MNTIPISPGSGSVAVIGGGIFGTLAALKLAEAGCRVTIFEAGGELLCGASLANQNRLHLVALPDGPRRDPGDPSRRPRGPGRRGPRPGGEGLPAPAGRARAGAHSPGGAGGSMMEARR